MTTKTPTTIPTAEQLQLVAPSALKGADRNSRTHSAKQVKQLADSIRTFGFVSPIIAQADYAKLTAAKAHVGQTPIPIRLDVEPVTKAKILPHRIILVLDSAANVGPVTLLYAAKSETRNNALALREWLERRTF